MQHQVTQSIIVNRDASDLYQLWSNFEIFPNFVENLKSVTKKGEHLSEWELAGPGGVSVTWEVETTTLDENARIAWSTKDRDGDIKTSGQVTFTALPQNQTEVTVTLKFVTQTGTLGVLLAHLFSQPEARLRDDLRNFKTYAEGILEQVS